MLIIKKYRDYYDTALGINGVDKTCVYNRVPFVSELLEDISFFLKNRRIYTYDVRKYSSLYYNEQLVSVIKPFIIGFCGKLYPAYVIRVEFKDHLGYNLQQPIIVFSMDEFKNIYDKLDGRTYVAQNKWELAKVIDFFAFFKEKEYPELFIKHRIPVFVVDYGTSLDSYDPHKSECIIFNPRLQDYGFYRIFDAVQANQEIQMYLQNVLCSHEKEVIQISDLNRLKQHGFDAKWSFRKEPTKL